LEVGGVDEAAEGDEVLTTVGASDGSWVGIIVGTWEGSLFQMAYNFSESMVSMIKH
jgi:hypothetical protein